MSDTLFDLNNDPAPATVPVAGAAAVRHTEADVLAALRARYSLNPGNGPRWVYADHVRSAAGFPQATRTADFVAVDVWPSQGLAIHGHEVKVSRSDWLRELKDPSKAEAFTGDAWHEPLVDYWWIVTSDVTIVKQDELLPRWGLMVTGPTGRLRVAVAASRLTGHVHRYAEQPQQPVQQIDRSFAVSLMRAIGRTRQTLNEGDPDGS